MSQMLKPLPKIPEFIRDEELRRVPVISGEPCPACGSRVPLTSPQATYERLRKRDYRKRRREGES